MVLLTLLGEVLKNPSEGPRGTFSLFFQSISVHYTYSFKFSMFDFDVTFETKSPVDIKEALRGAFNKLPCVSAVCGRTAQDQSVTRKCLSLEITN